MSRFKLIAAAVAVILVIVVILQNTAPVEMRILFMKKSMPGALLLFVAVGVGFAGGLVAAMSVLKKKPFGDEKSSAKSDSAWEP